MNNFEQLDKDNIIQYMRNLTSSKVGVRIVKNTLGLFHIEKKETTDNIFLSPESWINLLTTN
jgi:hypothetical protein